MGPAVMWDHAHGEFLLCRTNHGLGKPCARIGNPREQFTKPCGRIYTSRYSVSPMWLRGLGEAEQHRALLFSRELQHGSLEKCIRRKIPPYQSTFSDVLQLPLLLLHCPSFYREDQIGEVPIYCLVCIFNTKLLPSWASPAMGYSKPFSRSLHSDLLFLLFTKHKVVSGTVNCPL